MKHVSLKVPYFFQVLGIASLAAFRPHNLFKRGGEFLRPASPSAIAVITGASAGLGAEFARQLAALGYHLVLVARRVERLQELANELRADHGVDVTIQPADLSSPDDLARLTGCVSTLPGLEILVNNAGFGLPRPFAKQDAARQLDMIHVHDMASVALTRAVLPGMIRRGRGGVINVSSVASFIPLRANAIYSASKAFLNVFSAGVQEEISGTGVYVQSLCPGFTHTEFHKDLPGYSYVRKPGWLWMQANDVVRKSIAGLGGGEVVLVTGWINRLLAWILQTRALRPFVRIGARLLIGEGVMHR